MIEEIRKHFATGQYGLRQLSTDPIFPAYTIREATYYGVAMPCEQELLVSEHSTNARLFTKKVIVNNSSTNLLIFGCLDESLRNEFATMCVDFITPGNSGEKRKLILKSPIEWWNKWIDLMGNKRSEKTCYNIIAEMLALKSIYESDNTVRWASDYMGSHDLESDTISIEVKSTIKKSETNITISSQHQLKSERPLFLYFCRLEESAQGVSINDVKHMLVALGYPENLLESQIEKFGFEMGTAARDAKYRVLETRKYIIDDAFPKITKDSFIGYTFPEAIIKITYTIDLNGLPYSEWDNAPI